MKHSVRNLSLVCAFVATLAIAAEPANPSVAHIQRTMARIAGSTAAHPNTVRVLFYGQSITAQAWTKLVGDELARQFPTVKFDFRNAAIGGFTSPALIRTAEHDLYPWYPDLLIFHVYGPVDKYEDIIRNTRARTTAEIVLWTSHLSATQTLDKKPDEEPRIVAIREIAKRYDCLLVDIRKKWIAHIEKQNLQPPALLRDSVHLNDDGVRLMASFFVPEFVRVAGLEATPQAGTVTEIPLKSPAITRDSAGNLSLAFTGNRVVVISGSEGSGEAEVLLDGAKMDGKAELWAVSRPSTGPQIWMPAIKQVSFEKALLREDWALTCLPDSAPDAKLVHFKVTGSATGDDGEGFSNARFVSKSGRVVIDPADWHLAWSLGYKKLALPANFQVKWKTYPLFTNPYKPQAVGTETVLVQNCSNGAHTLTIKGSAETLGISSFRVYSPAPLTVSRVIDPNGKVPQ